MTETMRHIEDLEKTRFTETKDVRVLLSESDIKKRGELLAEMVNDVADLEQEAKNSARDYREQKKRLSKAVIKQCDAVRYGTELQPRTCTWYADWGTGKRHLVRDDTQEELQVEDIPDDWRQGTFDDSIDS